jgi:hypothetical protein
MQGQQPRRRFIPKAAEFIFARKLARRAKLP